MRIPKDQIEKSLVGEYLEWKGIKVLQLEHLAEFCPDHGKLGIAGPDVRAHCDIHGNSEFLGIELTEHPIRKGPSGSLHAMRDALAEQISNRIQDAWVRILPALRNCLVTIDFDDKNLPRMRSLNAFADELARFVNDHPSATSEQRSFRRRSLDIANSDFSRFPLLQEHLESLRVIRAESRFPIWIASSADSIGIDREGFLSTIGVKSAKLQKYDLTCRDKCWLLIAAIGRGSRIGPPLLAQELSNDEKLAIAARSSGFKRVIIWERVRDWDVDLVSGVVGLQP